MTRLLGLVLAAAFLAAPLAHRSLGEGAADVRMVEVTGEALSIGCAGATVGQGQVAVGNTPQVVPERERVEDDGARLGIRRRSWGDHIFLTPIYGRGSARRCSRIRAPMARSMGDLHPAERRA
jgi:hypothetical protein